MTRDCNGASALSSTFVDTDQFYLTSSITTAGRIVVTPTYEITGGTVGAIVFISILCTLGVCHRRRRRLLLLRNSSTSNVTTTIITTANSGSAPTPVVATTKLAYAPPPVPVAAAAYVPPPVPVAAAAYVPPPVPVAAAAYPAQPQLVSKHGDFCCGAHVYRVHALIFCPRALHSQAQAQAVSVPMQQPAVAVVQQPAVAVVQQPAVAVTTTTIVNDF